MSRPIGAPSPLARERLRDAVSELEAYFAGSSEPFRVPCDFGSRGAPFEARVWEAVKGIRFGSVASYGEVAARLGLPGAARAVGRALGRNPLPIFVPCHRVVGADGRLVGFSAGLPLKAALLRHEGVRLEGGPGRWSVARSRFACAPRPRRVPEGGARGGGGRPLHGEDRRL